MMNQRGKEFVEAFRTAEAVAVRGLGTEGNNVRRPSDERKEDAISRRLRRNVALGRVDKYALREGVQYLLWQYDRDAREPMFRNTRLCGSVLRSDELSAAVVRGDSVFQTNLTHCDSVWLCPTCATAIQSARSQSISDLIAVANAMGYRVGMVTLTAHHSRADSLDDIITRFRRAYSSVKRTRKMAKIRAEAGILGVVRVTEITRSLANGWHYHYHILVLFEKYFDANAVKREWLKALVRNGFVNDAEGAENAARHAFKFDLMRRGGDSKTLARYINKMAAEISYSTKKQGRGESLTTWDIAARAFTSASEKERAMYRRLFWEYACATKGKKQMTKTPKLWERFDLKEQKPQGEEVIRPQEIAWGLTAEHIRAMRKAGKMRVYMQEIAPRGIAEMAEMSADEDGRIAPPRAVVSFFRRLGCKSSIADNVTTWQSYVRFLVKMSDMGTGAEKQRAEVARLGRSALDFAEKHDIYAERKYADYIHAVHSGASKSLLNDMWRTLPLKSDKNAMLLYHQ